MHPRGAKTLPQNPFLALLRELKSDVDGALEAVLRRELSTNGKHGVEVEAMISESMALCLRGGKRLRAALVLAGQKATEPRALGWQRAIRVGVAVELLQSYFLIHDDWMDQDATRRGGPSLHIALGRRFGSAHRGACGAILAGDYLAALATRTFVDATRGHPRQRELLAAFVDMQTSAVIGQQLDAIQLTGDAELIYAFKTASYTVGGPLKLGALLAGASPKTLLALNQFARPLGIAFQLRDDLLSLFADPKRTGKPRASDLREGKRTWIVQWTLLHGTPAERRALEAALGQSRTTRATLSAALSAIRSAGGEAAAEAQIRSLSERALKVLARAKLPRRGEALLRGAAQAFVERGA